MKLYISIVFSIVSCIKVLSQSDSSNLVEYTPNYKFREGFYLGFDQVASNSPLPKSRIISEYDYTNPDFFERVLEKDKLYYYDPLGNRKELRTKDIWGYSRNGFLYIRMDEGFFRITLIGAICHFIASQTTYASNYNSPYYYSYMDPYRVYNPTYQTTEMKQYILNFSTGDVLDYTDDSLGVILMQDPELHDEYMSLRKKKRKQMRFMYIRKFNEKHPLYFPQN